MAQYLTQCVHRAVQNHPARLATICGSREQTWRSFAERVARLAGALQALGLARGARVAILAHNSDRYLEVLYGVWWAGAVVNPVNYRWSAAEIAYSLDDCQTGMLLVDDAHQQLVPELRARSQSLHTVIHVGDARASEGMYAYEELLAAHAPVADACGSGSELAAVMYTGGTTGFPKGVMLGYWGKPAATTAALIDGWMHTGDGARMDDDGYVYIVDRMKDMIVTGGENVYSAEVENALASHPTVATCAVIGIPSDLWGESVHAVVVLKAGAGATDAELIAHCRSTIGGYKVPRSVEFRVSLPVTGAGKVQKNELRKPHWEGLQRKV